LDPEYYNNEVEKLKLKVRKAYNRRKLGQQYREELERLPKQLLFAPQKMHRRHFKAYTKK
jgi:hypothetical protein